MSFVDLIRGSLAGQLMLWFIAATMLLVFVTDTILYLTLADGVDWAAEELSVRRSHYARLFWAAVLLPFGLALVTGWYLARFQLRSLKRLSKDVASIEPSVLEYRISPEGLPKELSEFAVKFNQVLDRLDEARGLRRYADDVAHELRTPLNRMLLGLEVALNENRSPEAYRQVLESMFEECEHLNKTVASLLFLARAENGRAKIAAEPMDVADHLEKIHSFFEATAAEAGVRLSMDCKPPLRIDADPTLFQRAVGNVVANALAHTPRGGVVSLEASPLYGGVSIDVTDTGEGIAPEDQPRVFDRFYRADKARATDRDRVGLGLAITRAIVDLHRGRITLQSSPGLGTRFSLFFPQETQALQAAE